MSDKLKCLELEMKNVDETHMYVEDWELPDGDQYDEDYARTESLKWMESLTFDYRW